MRYYQFEMFCECQETRMSYDMTLTVEYLLHESIRPLRDPGGNWIEPGHPAQVEICDIKQTIDGKTQAIPAGPIFQAIAESALPTIEADVLGDRVAA